MGGAWVQLHSGNSQLKIWSSQQIDIAYARFSTDFSCKYPFPAFVICIYRLIKEILILIVIVLGFSCSQFDVGAKRILRNLKQQGRTNYHTYFCVLDLVLVPVDWAW